MTTLLVNTKELIRNEFLNLSLGDARLNKRCLEVANMINSSPSLSIPSMSGGNKAQLKALYRFFQNPNVTSEKLLETHYINTLDRMCEYHGKILLVFDSTFITPEKHFTGLLTRGKGNENCIRCHYCLAVSADGGQLFGILNMTLFNDMIIMNSAKLRNESDIWIKSAENCINLIRSCRHSDKLLERCLFIEDRESDEYDLLDFLTSNGLGFVIRSRHDRNIVSDDIEDKFRNIETHAVNHGNPYKIRTQKNKTKVEVVVRRKILKEIEITRPRSSASSTCGIIINTVIVSSIDQKNKDIHWRILTSEKVDHPENSALLSVS